MRTEYKRETILLTAKQQVLATYENVEWKPFQNQILDLISTQADGRTLIWYHTSNEHHIVCSAIGSV